MGKALGVVAAGAVAVAAVACTQRLGDLTVASTKNIMISSFNPNSMRSTRAEGRDCKAMILMIPTGVPNIESAIDNALSRAGNANFMTDAVITSKFWTAIVYGQTCYLVTGNAWTLQVASSDTDRLRDLALERGGTGSEVRMELADGTTLTGAMLGFGRENLVVRPAGGGEVRVIDRAGVRDLQAVEQDQ